MPKLILSYKLPEEREEAELAQSAGELYSMLWDIAQYARTLRKYDERVNIPKEEVEQKLSELLSDFKY
jgi:hypothetical protein